MGFACLALTLGSLLPESCLSINDLIFSMVMGDPDLPGAAFAQLGGEKGNTRQLGLSHYHETTSVYGVEERR